MSLSLTATLNQAAFLPGTAQTIYALVELGATAVLGRMPLDLRLVLDNSSSMTDTAIAGQSQSKIALLVEAVVAMLALTQPGDHVTIIAFEDRARTLYDGVIRHDADRKVAQKALTALKGGGGTMVSQGLRQAMADAPLPGHVTRVVLVTDGETCNDEDDCLQMAFDQRGAASYLVYGIGIDYNDCFLDQLADANGGTFVHLGDMAGAAAVFGQAIAVMGEVALTSLVASIETEPGVAVTRVDRIVPEVLALPVQDAHYVAASLGDVDRVRGQKLLVQFAIPAFAAGDHPLARLRCAYHVPIKKLLNQQDELLITATFSAEAVRLSPDADVLRTVQLAGAGRLYTLAMAEATAGQVDQSARTLTSAAGVYDHLGLGDMGDQLRTLTSGLATRGVFDEDAKRTLTTRARQAGLDP